MNEHTDDSAIDRFAAAMKSKMAKQRDKGYGDWDNPAACPAERLVQCLRESVLKGDPVDVGNFAMMLFNRGQKGDAVAPYNVRSTPNPPTALDLERTAGAVSSVSSLVPTTPENEEEPDSECKEADGCPTEGVVLKRFWREHQPDPKLCEFYQVKTLAELVAAQEEHVLKLQDMVRRNVKPWEDTMPPTLLPKYLRDTGLDAAEPKVQTVVVYGATPPESGGQGGGKECKNCGSRNLSWQPHMQNRGGVADGRIRMSEVSCAFVLGCDECSEDVRTIDAETVAARLTALTQPQPPEGGHCATCSCAPGMTKAVRFDASPAEKEGVIRDHLISLGWTPPEPGGKTDADEEAAARAFAERVGEDWDKMTETARDTARRMAGEKT